MIGKIKLGDFEVLYMCNVIMVEEIVSVTDGRETVTISFFYLHLFRLCLSFSRLLYTKLRCSPLHS